MFNIDSFMNVNLYSDNFVLTLLTLKEFQTYTYYY